MTDRNEKVSTISANSVHTSIIHHVKLKACRQNSNSRCFCRRATALYDLNPWIHTSIYQRIQNTRCCHLGRRSSTMWKTRLLVLLLYPTRHHNCHQCSNGASFYDRTSKHCPPVLFTITKKTYQATGLSVLYRTHYIFILVYYSLSDIPEYKIPPNQTPFNPNSMNSHFIPCSVEDTIRVNSTRHQTRS